MEIKVDDWRLDELVTLTRVTKVLKMTWFSLYEQMIGSRYICIREATDNQHGILVKVLGKIPSEHIMLVRDAILQE